MDSIWPRIISVWQNEYGNTKYEFECRCVVTHFDTSVTYKLCETHFNKAFPTDLNGD